MKKLGEEFYQNSSVDTNFTWSQNNTGGVIFEEIVYCVDSNHYITHDNWIVCETCNGVIKNKLKML